MLPTAFPSSAEVGSSVNDVGLLEYQHAFDNDADAVGQGCGNDG